MADKVFQTGEVLTAADANSFVQKEGSGWNPIVLSVSGYSLSQSGAWIKIGNIVYLRGLLTKSSGTIPPGNTEVFTLPSAACPDAIAVMAITDDGNGTKPTSGSLRVNVNGVVNIASDGANRLWLHCSWVAS